MKKINLLLSLLLPLSLFAQLHQGAIVYQRKTDIRRHMKDEQMRAMAPPFLAGDYQLLFKDSLSVYKALPKDEAPDPFENNKPGGHGMSINMKMVGGGDDGVLFTNFSSGRLLEEALIEDRKYIITDTVGGQSWKLSDDTATILGRTCKKATTTNFRGQTVIAWYCADIPMPIGPERYAGLPGAILKADIGDGEMVYQAKEIHDGVNAKDIKAPGGGKLISRADFQKKLDETMGPADGQGHRTIRN